MSIIPSQPPVKLTLAENSKPRVHHELRETQAGGKFWSQCISFFLVKKVTVTPIGVLQAHKFYATSCSKSSKTVLL